MRNFAAFVQDRLSYERFTLNLGLRWSYYDGDDSRAGNGGAHGRVACAACNVTYPGGRRPGYTTGTRWRRAPGWSGR